MIKENIKSFVWQHFLLLISLFVMTLGVAICVRSMLGSSVISVLPYVFQNAGSKDLAPNLTIGQYTYIMNFILVIGQILVLRKQFQLVQLFQLLIGFVFGIMIDLNMTITSWLLPKELWQKCITQLLGCTVLGLGIAFEVRCGSLTMPGEGFPVAISRVLGVEFPKVKICVDISLVIIGIIACYCFFGAWQWHIIGIGTLFAMFYIGIVVRFVNKHLKWFDKLLNSRPGFRRYIYGLKNWIVKK